MGFAVKLKWFVVDLIVEEKAASDKGFRLDFWNVLDLLALPVESCLLERNSDELPVFCHVKSRHVRTLKIV